MFVNIFRGRTRYEKQEVLKDISLEIKKGEFFGVVGRNGSGKSTLLKLLAGVYSPDSGAITVNGKLTPFIELGVGFSPELTGRENVFLNGSLLGFAREEMEKMYDEIVEFAELERFMDQKLKNYSSGMQVRLAFSVAIRAQPDILLLDEVLAVGDEAFQKKCYEYFSKLKKDQKTVVLVTHDMEAVKRFCTRAMLVSRQGKISKIGTPSEVAKAYENINKYTSKKPKSPRISIRKNSLTAKISALDDKNKITSTYTSKQDIILQIEISSEKYIDDIFVGLTIQKSNGELIYWVTTEDLEDGIKSLEKDKPIKIRLKIQNIFGEDAYSVNLSVKSHDRTTEYLIADEILEFNVMGEGSHAWMLHPDYSLIVEDKDEKNS